MNCATIQKSLSAYLDREVHAWEKENIVTHLDRCLACQDEMKNLLEMKQWVRQQAMPALPDAVREGIVMETVLKAPSWKTWLETRWWVPTVAVAAGLAGWLMFQSHQATTPRMVPPEIVKSLESSSGKIIAMHRTGAQPTDRQQSN